jgi:hypothetical protein
MADSFSNDVRTELCGLPLTTRHCVLAELAAMLNAIQDSDNPHHRLKQLMRFAFQQDMFTDSDSAERVFKATAFPLAVTHTCCKRAYARGSFIAAGTLSDPLKSYHLEYMLPRPVLALQLRDIYRFFKLKPKIICRKSYNIVYFKESESIAEALNIMGAYKSMFRFENIRLLKDMRNDVNRKVNFETANLTKTVSAALGQIEAIKFIIEKVGLGYLDKPLEEVAQLRLAHEDASLEEIGAMLAPPIGKSGVNHRLRKIHEITEGLKKGDGYVD